jgi:rare lipoprotein A
VHEVRLLVAALVLALAGCPASQPKRQTVVEEPAKKRPKKTKKKQKVAKAEPVVASDAPVLEVLEGRAVWYGGGHHGGPTASGERFDKRAMTAAHRDLPLGSKVRVTNKRNGKSVVVRINDRGPYGKDRRRIIDLSEAAAKKLDYIDAGWTEVTVEVLERPPPKKKKKKK